jgi:hypothetical protein
MANQKNMAKDNDDKVSKDELIIPPPDEALDGDDDKVLSEIPVEDEDDDGDDIKTEIDEADILLNTDDSPTDDNGDAKE